MKLIAQLLVLLFLGMACNSQETESKQNANTNTDSHTNSNSTTVHSPNDTKALQYQIDESVWYDQDKEKVLAFFEETMKQKPQFTKEQIVGFYTTKENTLTTYPSIMLLDTKLPSTPPSLDQLEKELNAMSVSLDDIGTKSNLKEVITDFDFKRPMLIKEKGLILMETNAVRADMQEITVRQAMFFRGKRLLAVQISYFKEEQDQFLNDFNTILETLEF